MSGAVGSGFSDAWVRQDKVRENPLRRAIASAACPARTTARVGGDQVHSRRNHRTDTGPSINP